MENLDRNNETEKI